MYLIAKNKIANYIQQHPEAATALLTWLKEYPERQAKSVAHMLEPPNADTVFTSMNGVGKGDYQVECRVNFTLKAFYIKWVGSKQELEAREQAKFEQKQAANHGLQCRVKITEIVLVPPPPINIEAIPVHVGLTAIKSIAKMEPIIENPYVETDLDFKTLAEYDKALARAIEVFDSQPGLHEFDELVELIPLVAHYEGDKIGLPELNMLDVIKYKMDLFEMVPQQLTPMIGTTEEINLYMAGKQPLTAEQLDKLCKLLFIMFDI